MFPRKRLMLHRLSFYRHVQTSRALLTASKNRRANSAIRSGWLRRMASLGMNSLPTPSATAHTAMKLNAVR
jgi:hypothetical protein